MALSVVMNNFGLLDQNWRGNLRNRLQWCDENCRGMFLHDILSHNILWSFLNNEDAVAFKLRW